MLERNKPHVNVGTIGHIHHGKTTLTAAITAVQSRRLGGEVWTCAQLDGSPEEQALGCTVDTAHVEYETQARHYTHIDCPGHVEYIKNMLIGASQMDAAILVCSAVDGPGPQTREHIVLARQMGVSYIVVYLDRADSVGAEALERVKTEVRALLSQYDFPGPTTPVVCGSALLALAGDPSEYGEPSIARLMDALDTHVPTPERDLDRPFMMPIAGAVSVSTPVRGTVVTGRVERGLLKVGEELEIVGIQDTILTTCLGVQTFRKPLEQGQAGDDLGVLLRGLRREDIERGAVLARPGSLTPCTRFEASVYIPRGDEGGRHTPFGAGYCPQFYFRTADVTGTIELSGGVEIVMPGDSVEIVVTLSAPIVMDQGLRFAMREGGHTVGVGVIGKILV